MTYVAYTNAEKTRQETRALELRLLGKTYEFIAEELGVSPDTAWKRVQAALVRYAAPKAEEVRAQETARQQMTIDVSVAIASQPDVSARDRLAAVARIQAASETIARLHGSFAPVQVETSLTVTTPTDERISELIGLMDAVDA